MGWTGTVDKMLKTLRNGYDSFKDDKYNKELAAIAHQHGLQTADLKNFCRKNYEPNDF
jgi:type I restriction enzyme, R subunit